MAISFDVRSLSGGVEETLDFEARQVILGGFAARSADQVQRHIEELREIGVVPPARIPAFWHVSRWLLTTGDVIEVQGDRTSGEVEYVLIAHEGTTYVAVGSDETDRHFEQASIPRSKQLCPKVVSRDLVRLDAVIEAWDDIVIASEVSPDGQAWQPYQRSSLAGLYDPDALMRAVAGRPALPDGTVLMSGTIPIVDGVTRYLPGFRATMSFPGSDLELSLSYRVDVLPELTDAGTAA